MALLVVQERREKEDVVADLEENEREELFTKMNLDERSRVINLANKHTSQMLDLIHREKIKYLKEGDVEDIEARYPRDPPPVAPPQFTKQQVTSGRFFNEKKNNFHQLADF